MSMPPRSAGDYSQRSVDAARRVLIDIGQVLGSFRDRLVVVGGWVPDLLTDVSNSERPHVGSIDVDIALDANKLNDGTYAEILKLLVDTRRYREGNKPFQLVTNVNLNDGNPAVEVEIDFLASKDIKFTKRRPKLLPHFRVLQVKGCETAFRAPEQIQLSGQMIDGTENTVHFRVTSIPDFLILKAYALEGREKLKDPYDICFCLQHAEGGIKRLAEEWSERKSDIHIISAIRILREKFATVRSFGPQRYAQFMDENADMDARLAFELVNTFLKQVDIRDDEGIEMK